MRAKHRLGKYLLRYRLRPADDGRPWTAAWRQRVRALKLRHAEQNTTLLELILEVDHQGQRIDRFDAAIDQAVDAAPAQLKAIVDALQALRGVAKVSAVTLATEFGCFSRFEKAGQVMSYTGMVPSEHSSGPKTRRARRSCRPRCRRRLQPSPGVPNSGCIAATGHSRTKSKPSAKTVTALARELAGFVWAIGVETERTLKLGKAA